MASNNLYPVTSDLLSSDLSGDLTNPIVSLYSPLSCFPSVPLPLRTAPPDHPALRQPHFFYTPEQRNRARLYRELHYVFSHPGHDKLCKALDCNLIPGVNLTSADYKVYRDIYGQCPQCVQCKQKKKSMKPSTAAPATKIGQVLPLDLQGLPEKTIGGNTQSLTAVDELTGFMSCTGSFGKSALDLLVATIKLSPSTASMATRWSISTVMRSPSWLPLKYPAH